MKKNFNTNSIAAKLFNGLGRMLKKEDLGSGLTRMVSGTYYFMGTKTTPIEGRDTALAVFTNADESRIFSCGAAKFAAFLGAVGKDEQMSALENPDLVGNEYKIKVEGEGRDKVITFEATETRNNRR